ncbi:MAG: methyltransferase domain-containing protein [Betaproteobacteria bacterium]|nr:methyltransferase domain-containing protein [Betaproteobacteria bacterium]
MLFRGIVKKIALCIPPIKRLYAETQCLRKIVDESALTLEKENIRQKARLYHQEREKLLSLENKKLNLGCGNSPLEGWTNIDGGDGKHFDPPGNDAVVKLDVFTAMAEIADASVSYITSEQFFEHFTRQEGFKLLRECFRVLKKGGVIRTQVPDLYITVKCYLDEWSSAPWKTIQLPHRLRHISGSQDPYAKLLPGETYLPSMFINNGFHMDGHKFLYDYETLEQSLRLAGFSQIERCKFGNSRHEILRGIDKHDGGETGCSWIPHIALTVEATK